MSKKKSKSKNYGSKRKISPYLSSARYNNNLAARQAANEYRFYNKGEKIERKYLEALENANTEIKNILENPDVELADYSSLVVKFVMLKKTFEEKLKKTEDYFNENKENMSPEETTAFEANILNTKSIIENFKVLFDPSLVFGLFAPITEEQIEFVENAIITYNTEVDEKFPNEQNLKLPSYKEIYDKLLLLNNDENKEDEPSNEDYQIIRNGFLTFGRMIISGYYDIRPSNISNVFLFQRFFEAFKALTIPDKNLFNVFIKSLKN